MLTLRIFIMREKLKLVLCIQELGPYKYIPLSVSLKLSLLSPCVHVKIVSILKKKKGERENLDLLCINLVSMPYVGGNKYNFIESNKVKIRFVHGQWWKRCLLSNFILWIVKKSCHIEYKIIIGQEVHIWIILKSQIFHH